MENECHLRPVELRALVPDEHASEQADAPAEDIHILIIDDDPGNLQAYRSILEAEGRMIVSACSGPEGLSHLLERDFAVVLLDVFMPQMNGLETAELIRNRERTRDVPIIFLTGADESMVDVSQGYKLGAVDFLIKPIIPDILEAKVAVFGDLYRKQQQLALARQRDLKHRTEQLEQLQKMLEHYRTLSSDGATISVARRLSGMAPIRERLPETFNELQRRYGGLLQDYLRQMVVKSDKPIGAMRRIVNELGELGAGPRDLLDIHLEAIQASVRKTAGARAHALAVDGRMLALEMMGLLVDYYRIGGPPKLNGKDVEL